MTPQELKEEQERRYVLMRQLYDLGAPDRAIGRILSVSGKMVALWRENNNLPVVPDGWKWFDRHDGITWEETMPIRLKVMDDNLYEPYEPPEYEPYFCEKCGGLVLESMIAFCGHCGNPLFDDDEPPEEA